MAHNNGWNYGCPESTRKVVLNSRDAMSLNISRAELEGRVISFSGPPCKEYTRREIRELEKDMLG